MELFKFLKWSWTNTASMAKFITAFFLWDVICIILCFFISVSSVYAIWVCGVILVLGYMMVLMIADTLKDEWNQYKRHNEDWEKENLL